MGTADFTTDSIRQLFGNDYLIAYGQGTASSLIFKRNRNLGYLLNSEHAIYYVQILYRMLIFRRDHELEPLNEDIYSAVKSAQESVTDDDEYTPERYNMHMRQLFEWKLLTQRIEKERLRGYKDVRRNKFRFSLTDDAVTFLLWLEERLHDDLDDKSEDTRNLLIDLTSRLTECLRELNRFQLHGDETDERSAQIRTILYLIHQANDLVFKANKQLGDLNARLLSFLLNRYKIEEARAIVRELDYYLQTYLRQIDGLRKELLPDISKLLSKVNLRKIDTCIKLMDEERKKVPHLIKATRYQINPEQSLRRLYEYFDANGQLARLCHRVNDSAMKVWGKMSAHLRELERKNNRLEDLKERIRDMAKMAPNRVPITFFQQLLRPAQMVADPHYWDEFEKATPPQPRRESEISDRSLKSFIRAKKTKGEAVQSLEDSRLHQLKQWMDQCFKQDQVSKGEFTDFEDLQRVMELAKIGILAEGKKLRKIHFALEPVPGEKALVKLENFELEFDEMKIRCIDNE